MARALIGARGLERRSNETTIRRMWDWPALCKYGVGRGQEVVMLHRRVMGMALAGSAGAALLMAGAPAQNQPASTYSLNPGPADPALRVVALPNGKKMHLLPATLETTQWGWFDNAQPPVLRVNSGDVVALETMMHSHNQVVPGTT